MGTKKFSSPRSSDVSGRSASSQATSKGNFSPNYEGTAVEIQGLVPGNLETLSEMTGNDLSIQEGKVQLPGPVDLEGS